MTTVVRIKVSTRDRLNGMKKGRETTDDLINRALDALQLLEDQYSEEAVRYVTGVLLKEKNRAKRQER